MMSLSRPRHSWFYRSLRFIAPVQLLLISFLITKEYSQSNRPETSSAATTLELNEPIKDHFAGDQKHIYQIQLPANQYIKILIEQRGSDVGARLTGEDGKKIADF